MGSIKQEQLQDLFLLFASAGRSEKVILGLSDTMYKRRASTARGGVDTMTKDGFREFARSCPGLLDGLRLDPDYVFMQHLGMTPARTGGSRKFELTFDQFVEALAALAQSRYPDLPAPNAIAEMLHCHVRPLYVARFGADALAPDEEAGPTFASRASRRLSRVVMTTSGIQAAGATTAGPKMAVAVEMSGDGVVPEVLASGESVVGGGMVGGGTSSVTGSYAPSYAGLKRRPSMRVALTAGGSTSPATRGVASPPGVGGRHGSLDANSVTSPPTTGAYDATAMLDQLSAAVAAMDASRSPAYSINPFSPEARGPAPTRSPDCITTVSPAATSPAPPPSRVALDEARRAAGEVAGGVPTSPAMPSTSAVSEAEVAELRLMVQKLMAVVGQQQADLKRLKAENASLREHIIAGKG